MEDYSMKMEAFTSDTILEAEEFNSQPYQDIDHLDFETPRPSEVSVNKEMSPLDLYISNLAIAMSSIV